ncbi:MAG: hypothetical protein WA672_19805, partial [Candidatus Angelobacter sp.]
MSLKFARFLIFIFFLLALSHTPSYGQSSRDSSSASGLSDHDRLLLEKIDRLERRIAELVARTGIDSTMKQPDPAVMANGKLDQEG